jgi:peptidyl-tRNA hydrolase, PTH1 family
VRALAEAHWLVAGLGNPGEAYVGTRHNVGFAVVERLAAEGSVAFRSGPHRSRVALVRFGGTPVLLVEPLAFMNLSGEPVAACLTALRLPAERLVVVHDDLDLPLGRLRMVGEAGSGGHRGVTSIQGCLGTSAFPRVRIGIGRPGDAEEAAERVLSAFTAAEVPAAIEVIERAAAAVRSLVLEGLPSAMNRFNVRRAEVGPESAQRR